MADAKQINVELAYAKPEAQVLLSLSVDEGTTLAQAIEQSGVLKKFPEINLAENKVGIFGKIAAADTVLREKDRVEIYRPLIADPKASRRKRAEKKQHKNEE